MIAYGVSASLDSTAAADGLRWSTRRRWHRSSRPPAPPVAGKTSRKRSKEK